MEDEEKVIEMYNLYFGIKMQKNQEKARLVCKEISEKGHPLVLGLKYIWGWDCEEDVGAIIAHADIALASVEQRPPIAGATYRNHQERKTARALVAGDDH